MGRLLLANMRGEERARYVARMFARISGRYDLLNTVMTAGRHYGWRRMAVDMALGDLTGPALDVASGTGDFALDLARRPQVTRVACVDFAPEMLRHAGEKARRAGVAGRIEQIAGDAHALPFPDDQFICATVGFGIRNFIDVPAALSEMARVVRPGGRVVVLEIVRMQGSGPAGLLFPLYFRYVTPWLGATLAGDREAYTYLPESVQGFMSAAELTSAMENAGLGAVKHKPLALGPVAIHVGEVTG